MSFDPTPLTEPVDRATVKAHRAQLIASRRAPRAGAAGIVLGVVLALFFGITLLNTVIGAIVSASHGDGFGSYVPLLVIGAVSVGATLLIVRNVRGSAERGYRLDRFAQANGLTWYPRAVAPSLPGMIFGHGSSREAVDIVRGERPRFVEFGNYRYTTGSGKNKTTHRWGYVAIKLASPLPHIVLDAVGNNALFGSNLPRAFDKDQRLSLEGDFDRHFTLYCPEGYEQDALYLFTPDIMARFIDHAAQLDVEIIDDWMFLYRKGQLATLDPGTWAWLFSVVGALLDKLAQWERWRDDRLAAHSAATTAGHSADVAAGDEVGAMAADATGAASLPFASPVEALRPPPGVAAEGRRLKQRLPWFGIIVTVLFVIAFFVLQFADVIGTLVR